jgi:hypothetical protein
MLTIMRHEMSVCVVKMSLKMLEIEFVLLMMMGRRRTNVAVLMTVPTMGQEMLTYFYHTCRMEPQILGKRHQQRP